MKTPFKHDLDLYFLGPKSEQRQFLTEALQLVLNDHVFWRRNYFPKDPPTISYSKVHDDQARHFREVFFTELFSLISDLKLDVPVFSPRYMAHMISETTLPSLVAYFATLLYNPNNVSSEASPVTIRHELEVGLQFARLFGYDDARSFGHLTSGGTIANYESLWFNKAGRFLPVALEMARRKEDGIKGRSGPDALYEALNVPLDEAEAQLNAFLSFKGHPDERWDVLRKYLISYVGDYAFKRMAEEEWETPWVEPVVVVPGTAHYSWARAASLLGIGKNNFVRVDCDEQFRMIPEALDRTLAECRVRRMPIWQIVTVTGTTEFGSVDEVDRIVAVRDAHILKGTYAPIHVDGAYGGYFATMFRPAAGGANPDIERDEWLERAYKGIAGTDSVTVDPHKAGYTPYGAGSIVLKHGFLKDLVAETAPYCLDREDTTQQDTPSPQLGKFILEGSKPGAVAAAVWFSHKLIPLDQAGYGLQLSILCDIAKEFDQLIGKRENLHSLFRPQTNIVCMLARKKDTKRISDLNVLNENLAARFGVRDVVSIQGYDYLVSRTTVRVTAPAVLNNVFLNSLEADEENLVVLRLVFMNRWVQQKQHSGKTYLTDFLDLLEEAVKSQ
jgi:glutamate/tyrosine decarboxylase-like PLP-dependent enzyme